MSNTPNSSAPTTTATTATTTVATRVRPIVAMLLGVVIALLATLVTAQPAAAAPAITVDPAGGAPAGALVTVAGTGFAPGESVSVAYVGSMFGPVFTDDAGGFSLTFTVPDAPPDSHPLEVNGDQGSAVSLEYSIIAGAPPTTTPVTTAAPVAAPTTVAPAAAPPAQPTATTAPAAAPAATTPSASPESTTPPLQSETPSTTPAARTPESDAPESTVPTTAAPSPTQVPVPDTTSDDDGGTPGWWLIVVFVVFVVLVVGVVFKVGTRRGQLRDKSWVKRLGKIDKGLTPVAPPTSAPDWSLHVHDGKQWVPIRNPKNAAYEYRLRLASHVAIAATPKHRASVTSHLSQRPNRNRPKSMHELAQAKTLRRYGGQGSRVVDEATEQVDGANLEASAQIAVEQITGSRAMAHLDPDLCGLEIAPLARVDDVTRVELVARGVAGAELKNQWTAQGASWKQEVARYKFAEGDNTGANWFELGRDVVRATLGQKTTRATMVAATNVESTVELDLAYAVATLAPGATTTPPSKPEKKKIKEGLTAAVKAALGPLTSKVPGFDFFSAVATGDMSADEGSGGGTTNHSGRNQSTKVAAQFTTEIVNNATVTAAIHHFRSDNDDNVDVEASTKVYHHVKIDAVYGGPPMNWVNGKPEFTIEIGRAAAPGAPAFTPPPPASGTPGNDAVITIGGKVVADLTRYQGGPNASGKKAIETYSSTTHWTPTRRP